VSELSDVDDFETLADAWEWTQTPVGEGPLRNDSSPEQALALLMAYAGGIPRERIPYEDSDELVRELGEVVWNTLRLQQSRIAEQREYLRESTRAEIEMMQRSLKEHQAVREVIRDLENALADGDERIAIATVLRELKQAVNYRGPREGRRRG
jgi:hypothetical protein